ncbi:unnamed protein product [Alternaria alternata]
MGNVQTWPPVRVATQNGEDDGTEVTSTPNVKQNEIDGRESSGKMRKKRKRRTLKHLVRMCEKFGDNSDKSGILARWRKCLKDPRWQYAVDAGDSDSGYSDYEDYRFAALTGYSLAANVTIPISRFTSRTCLELKRMSQIPHGKARAFQLALMFRLDFLRFEKLKLEWWRKGVHETDALLLDLLDQEQKDWNPEHPLDCAHAFLSLTSYIEREQRVLDQLRSVLDKILSLVVRDLRREYRRHLILAFSQRLPADICEEILDWVEMAHGIPRTVEEYAEGLSHSM